MRILVSGGAGFVGQFLVPRLRELGHDVYCLEEYFFRTISDFSIAKDHIFLADIRDTFALNEIFLKVRPEVVIHLAAMTAVAYSYNRPQETIMTNLIGTVNVAEMSRLLCPNLKQFIFPSSAEVYGVNNIPVKKETDPLVPNSPYAVSKRGCEDYLFYMKEAYDFPVTVFRPFNSYGRRDSHWFVIEKAIWQMVRGNKVCYLGDPIPVRDFLYIDDHVDAYIKAVNNPKAFGETFNLSTGVGITIKNLAATIKRLTTYKGKIEWESMPPRPLDIMHLVGANDKLKNILGWKEPLPLEEGLKKTIEYWSWKVEMGEDDEE